MYLTYHIQSVWMVFTGTCNLFDFHHTLHLPARHSWCWLTPLWVCCLALFFMKNSIWVFWRHSSTKNDLFNSTRKSRKYLKFLDIVYCVNIEIYLMWKLFKFLKGLMVDFIGTFSLSGYRGDLCNWNWIFDKFSPFKKKTIFSISNYFETTSLTFFYLLIILFHSCN